jgi:general secretion pathway protein G
MSKNVKAFTLIEILVALTIIGVLLTFVAPYVFDRPDQARNLKVKNDFLAIKTAFSLYKLDNGAYPSVELGIGALTANGSSQQIYLKENPIDPWGTPYVVVLGDDDKIRIVSAGKDKIFSNSLKTDDIQSEPIE